MSETKEKYLKGLTAIEILKHIYPNTLEQVIFDLQKQVNECMSWKEQERPSEERLSSKEIYELDLEISEKTTYVKSLLEFYAAYNWPSKEIQKLCQYYGVKTFHDNLTAQYTL